MEPRASLASYVMPLVMVSALLLGRSLAAAQTPDAQTVAREAYAAGVAAFQRADHPQALVNFVAADEAFPSPNVKLMLGRTLAKLQRHIEAHATLVTAIRDAHAGGPRYDQTARAASEELRVLEQDLAILNLRVDDPTGAANLRIAGRAIERAEWSEPIVAEPGRIEIALLGAEGQRDVKELEISAGTAASLALLIPEHAPEPEPEAPLPVAVPVPRPQASVQGTKPGPELLPFSYAAAGVGAVGVVAFGVLGALSNAQFAKLDEGCPNRSQCSAALKEYANRGQTYQTLANVSLAVGVAALATGVVLWVVALPDEHTQLTVTPYGARLTGAF